MRAWRVGAEGQCAGGGEVNLEEKGTWKSGRRSGNCRSSCCPVTKATQGSTSSALFCSRIMKVTALFFLVASVACPIADARSLNSNMVGRTFGLPYNRKLQDPCVQEQIYYFPEQEEQNPCPTENIRPMPMSNNRRSGEPCVQEHIYYFPDQGEQNPCVNGGNKRSFGSYDDMEELNFNGGNKRSFASYDDMEDLNAPGFHNRRLSLDHYNTDQQISDYVDYLGINYPNIARVLTIGHSVEGRPIKAININVNGTDKPGIIIDAGIHAREWIAPAVAVNVLHELVENYEQNRELVDSIEWTVIPLLNPDGYAYSMAVDRMWRKNRANTTDPMCPGVDLNRNFELFFGGAGTSLDPCDETYIGAGPFSEPETRALRDYALSKDNTNLYLTLHSYGKYFLYPWGFGDALPKDWKELDRLARVAEKALSSVYGTHYEVGSSTRLLGAAAGGSDDWMKARAGAKYSYTVELPGGGDKGFDLPESRISSVFSEIWEAFELFGFYIAEESR